MLVPLREFETTPELLLAPLSTVPVSPSALVVTLVDPDAFGRLAKLRVVDNPVADRPFETEFALRPGAAFDLDDPKESLPLEDLEPAELDLEDELPDEPPLEPLPDDPVPPPFSACAKGDIMSATAATVAKILLLFI